MYKKLVSKNNEKSLQKDKDVIEGFCGACLAVPLAFAGVGSSAYGTSSSRGNHKKQKKIALFIGVLSIIISLLIAVWYLYFSKCTDCR